MNPGTVALPFLNKIGLNSIQGRLTAIAFLFIVGTAIIIGVVGFQYTVNFESVRFREHFSLLTSYLAKNAELGVLLDNEKILEGLTESMLTIQDVQKVLIIDNNGGLIISRSRKDHGLQLDYVSAPVTTSAMDVNDNLFLEGAKGDEPLGQVTIAYSLTGLEQLKKQLAVGFITISLLLAIVPAIMYWRLSLSIRSPLQDVLSVARSVSAGHMGVRAEGGALVETATLAKAFNEMLDALQAQREKLKEANEVVARQQILAEVGKFSMTVAHEIKNPLAIIKGSLDILRKEGLINPDVKSQMFGFLDDEIERINKLIEDFLLFSRPRPPSLQPVLIRQVIASIRHRIMLIEEQIEIVDVVGKEIRFLELFCDLPLLERALLNIVRNALEASKDISAVSVTVSFESEYLIFSIQDNGPGIRAENINNIFEPFFSNKAKGTGLGLAIAKEVMTVHGGVLTAENLPKQGAKFIMKLPMNSLGSTI